MTTHAHLARLACALVAAAGLAVPAEAQTPAPTAPWSGTIGAGVSLTQGNTDTINYNISFDVLHPSSARNVMKATGLYLRGTQNDELNVSRTLLEFRDELTLSPRTFVFGELSYLRDTFKAIEYLVAPGGGVGFKAINTPRTQYALDAGFGAVTEKNTGGAARNSGAITLGEKLTHKLTDTASVKHELTALWKTQDLNDALYTFTAGLAAAVSSRAQLSVELQSIYKNRPPTTATKKNDLAIVTALTTKF